MSVKNAFKEVVGEKCTVKMCWAHAKKIIMTNVDKIKSKKRRKLYYIQDIDVLHTATSPDMFKSALAAFLIKYTDQRDFIIYFKKEWVC